MRSFFLIRGSLGLLVIIKIDSLNAVVSLPLQLFMKQQLFLESQHDEKHFNQMIPLEFDLPDNQPLMFSSLLGYD